MDIAPCENPKGKPTVLIVEDHEGVRTGLREWLTSVFPDCCFLEAKSGEEAVTMARDHQPDVVLMDIVLPQMSGIEATRHIKAAVPQAQVVILTIYEGSMYQTQARAAGATAYVPKRTMHRDLIPVISALLFYPVEPGPNNTRSG